MELTINQALQQGVAAHKAGKLQDAERLYRAILQSQPQHPDANHNLGVLAVSVGKAEVALPLFKAALEANQSAAQFWLSYIDVLIKLDRLPEAKAVFDQARVKGVQGEGLDRLERLLSQKTQAESPELNNSLLDTAIELKENGKFDQAIDLLQTGANQFPQDPNILALLSYCYILTDSLKEAVDYHDKAKSLAPDSASVGWNEVRLLLKRNDISKAVVTARSINKRFPDDIEGMGILGTCLRASNDIEESLLYLDKALSLDPTFAEALINRGLIRLTQNAKIEALADLEEAHKLKPHIKQIWDLVIGLKMEFEQFAEAILLLAVMTEIDPDNEQIFSNLGLCHQFLGELEEAVAAYKKAISLKPDYAVVYYNMGKALQEQSKLEDAIEAFNKAADIEPTNPKYYAQSGYTPTLLGRKPLTSHEGILDSVSNGDWLTSILLLNKACNINLHKAEAHVGEFISLWCEHCNKLIENADLKALIDIFIELYIIGERNEEVEKLTESLFDNFDFDAVIELTELQNIPFIKASYSHYKSLKGDDSACNMFSTESVIDAKALIDNKETEDRGWLVVRRSLSLNRNKGLARKALNDLIAGIGN